MAVPQSPAGERRRDIGYLTTMTLLTATLLVELLTWLALRAGMGTKVGVGALFWTLIALVALGSVILWSIVRALVRRRFRFGIKELLVGTLLVGAGLGWLVNLSEPTRAQRRIAAQLNGLGAVVEYGGTDEPGLETLIGREYFHGVTAVYGHNTVIRDADLAGLGGLPNLEILMLDGPQITDASLSHLKELTSLRQLGLFKTNVAGAGLADLNGLPHLERLDLYASRITDAGLAHLEGRPTLRALNLNQTPISDTGLAHVGGLAGLESLYLDRTRVTDAGLGHLTGLRNLSELHLAGTKITDKGLEHLKVLDKLRRLRLERSLVTDEGVSALRQARPDLIISK
jgi:hypothetical protein